MYIGQYSDGVLYYNLFQLFYVIRYTALITHLVRL